MTSAELVSIVVPVWNREHCIVEAVHSVLAQSHARVECVVVDDGSTDATVDRVRDAFGDDSRVRLLVAPHAGVSAARNRGVAEASGRFVTFLDSDDLMTPTRIERQLATLEDPRTDAVIGRQEQVEPHVGRPDWVEAHPEWWDGYYHTSVLVDIAHVRAVGGYDERLSIGEDLDLIARLAGAGVRILPLEEVVVTRRYFGDNLSYSIGEEGAFDALLRAVRAHVARRRAGEVAVPDAPDPSVAIVRAALDDAARAWDHVCKHAEAHTIEVDVAGVGVALTVVGDELAEMLLPGFASLPAPGGEVTAVVGAWDASVAGVAPPAPPPLATAGRYRAMIRRAGVPWAEAEWSSPLVFRSADRDRGRYLLGVRRSSALSPREGGAPLRRQLQWALGRCAVFVHAAAVGSEQAVVLIVGPGGAGKSSTALACLGAGLGFLSDDYCLVTGSPPVAHQLYSTARVADHDTAHFADVAQPDVDAVPVDEESLADGKALYHVHAQHPGRIITSAPVVAVVVLDRHRGDGPRLEPVTAGEALRTLAPSTLWQLSLDSAHELGAMRRLVGAVPCHRLVLSPDRAANPPLIASLLPTAPLA